MKVYLCFLVSSILCLWLLAACGLSTSEKVNSEQEIAAGRDIYLNHCSHCHQANGQGYGQVFPNLAGNPVVNLDTPEPTIEIVLHGRGGMPGFIDSLTGEERAEVISYIRNSWGNHASTITTGQAQ